MDVDEQARVLEKVQAELGDAGYATEQAVEGQTVHLAVWLPTTPGRRATVEAEDEDGAPIYRSRLELTGSRARNADAVRGFMYAVLGEPRKE